MRAEPWSSWRRRLGQLDDEALALVLLNVRHRKGRSKIQQRREAQRIVQLSVLMMFEDTIERELPWEQRRDVNDNLLPVRVSDLTARATRLLLEERRLSGAVDKLSEVDQANLKELGAFDGFDQPKWKEYWTDHAAFHADLVRYILNKKTATALEHEWLDACRRAPATTAKDYDVKRSFVMEAAYLCSQRLSVFRPHPIARLRVVVRTTLPKYVGSFDDTIHFGPATYRRNSYWMTFIGELLRVYHPEILGVPEADVTTFADQVDIVLSGLLSSPERSLDATQSLFAVLGRDLERNLCYPDLRRRNWPWS